MPKRNKTNAKVVLCFITIVVVIQLVISTVFGNLVYAFNDVKSESSNDYVNSQNQFISEVVREEMRLALSASRNRWNIYINESEPELDLLKTDSKGHTLYTKDGVIIAYDPSIYTIEVSNSKGEKNILKDGEIVLKDAVPVWNNNVLYDIFKIVTNPTKVFSNDSAITIFDSKTGSLFYNTLTFPDSDKVSTIEQLYGNFYTSNDLNEILKLKDSSAMSNITIGTDEFDFPKGINNFKEYPLGQYNRIFQEKIVLPSDVYGVNGEQMNITIILSIPEQTLANLYNGEFNDTYQKYNIISQISFIMITIEIIIIILVILGLLVEYKMFSWLEKEGQKENKLL